jgi:hypothetical protein
MRAVIAEDNSDRPTRQVPASADGVCFDLRLPLRLLKKRFWLSLCMAKDTPCGDAGSPPSYRQVVRSITTRAVILTLLFILLGETIFILYLIKCLFGIDVFPGFHLFS